MLLFCYLRLFLGVPLLGHMDEPYWVASAALSSHGGVPFVNDLHLQQLCGLMYEPLVAAYYKIVGNFAVILFVRHLYFVLSVFTAGLYYRFYRERTGYATALAIAALPMVGSYWAEPSLGYNAIGGLCYACGAILALRGLEHGRRDWMAWSGVFFFFTLGAYPTMLGALVVLWLFIALTCLHLRKPFWRQLLLANSITAVLLLALIGTLIWRSSYEDLLFAYRFSIAHASLGNIWDKLSSGFTLGLAFVPSLWIVLPFFAVWCGLWFWFRLSWVFFAVVMGLAIALREPPEAGPFHPPMFMLLAVSGLPLMIRSIRTRFAQTWPEVVLWAGSLVATVFPWWSSALTIYVTFVTSTYCFPPIFSLGLGSRFRPWIGLLTMVIPLIVFFPKMILNQIDDGVPVLELQMVTEGPLAGIWSSPERVSFVRQVQEDIDATTGDSQSILFYDEFPLGFLMTPLYPATRSLFMHTLRESARVRPYFQSYYADPAHRPDLIFRFNYFIVNGKKVSVHPDQFQPYEDSFWHYLPEESHEYELLRKRDAYSVFRKIRR